MNSTIWIMLWILAAIPLGKFAVTLFSKQRVEFGFAVVKLILTFFIAAILLFMTANDIVMWWIWLFWVIPWTIYELVSGTEDDPAMLCGVAVTAFIVFIIAGVSVGFVAGNNNAIYFDNFIVKSEGFPIKTEVPDNMLRLATQDLAESVVSQHMGEFGSSVERINSHIVVADGRLKWVSMIAKQESWGLTYRSDGMIAVDAVDPDLPVQPMHAKFSVAEGLDFNPLFGAMGNSNVKGYFDIDTGLVYGDTYPVFNPETKEWNLAMTTYRPDMFSVRKYSGVYVLNQRGEVINHYASDAPSWVIKPFDEHGFLESGIKDWGSHRRGDGFDLFAGGFLNTPPSNDRLEMTEDTRYVYNPDNGQIVAMIMVHSTRTNGENSLAGVFVADSDKITYYDLSKLDLMSGVAAGAIVKGKLTAGAGTTYETAMELLYPIKIGNQTRYCYFVPIYAHTTGKSIITLSGLGIVDAQSADKVVVEYTGDGVSGETLIKKAKESFRNLYRTGGSPGASISGTINGTIAVKYDSYVKSGNTHQWFTVSTDSGKYDYLMRTDVLDDEAILRLQKAPEHQPISFEADTNNVVRQVL